MLERKRKALDLPKVDVAKYVVGKDGERMAINVVCKRVHKL
jgi:hypothetical protein